MLGLFIEGSAEIFDRGDAIPASRLLPLPGLRRLGLISRPGEAFPTALGECVIDDGDFERVERDVREMGAALYHNPSLLRYPRPPLSQCQVLPRGIAEDVEKKVTQFTLSGETSLIVVADGGFDAAKLTMNGRPHVKFMPDWDFPPNATAVNPGHAFMVAWDCTLAAPRATLVNATMPSESDTKVAFAWKLMNHLKKLEQDGALEAFTGLVLCCAWESGDIDIDMKLPPHVRLHDNDRHPLRVMVDDLIQVGFDIVIGAGNCGCGVNPKPINGMNAYPTCLTVGAVNLEHSPDPMSSRGEPGSQKPDISAYSNFTEGARGAEPDSGTSAATGISSGIVAAIRSMAGTDRVSLPAGHDFREFLKKKVDRVVLKAGQRIELPEHDEGVGWGILH